MNFRVDRDIFIQNYALCQELRSFIFDVKCEIDRVNLLRKIYLEYHYLPKLRKDLYSKALICMKNYIDSDRSEKAHIREKNRLSIMLNNLEPKVYNEIHGLTELP